MAETRTALANVTRPSPSRQRHAVEPLGQVVEASPSLGVVKTKVHQAPHPGDDPMDCVPGPRSLLSGLAPEFGPSPRKPIRLVRSRATAYLRTLNGR